MEILKVENLTKTYGSGENLVHAVDDVSFSVEKGEFVAIVGTSGSGKSTLLNMIGGLDVPTSGKVIVDGRELSTLKDEHLHLIGGVDRPTSGKIFVDGNDISKMNDDKLAVFRRRQVGIVYQFYNLIPILTVEENITLPCDLDGRGVDRERLEMILDSFGLRARRKHLPNQLSGGQQQRTSIARALINNPSLVLADEPTGNLDSKSSEEVMSMLKMYNQSYGQTVIMITHNLDIAKQADRIITISDGKIVEEV